jgi:putative toxin-antitoxin system antitoxin component (TIGR02293 family)
MATVSHEEDPRRLVSLLGGQRAFTPRIRTSADMQEALRKGFPYAAFEAVLAALQLSNATLVGLVGASPRTMARRKAKRVLSPTESDRLYRVARVTLEAEDTFGSLEKARTWLHRPNQALGGDAPIGQLDTEIGERHVERLLDRIDHGIYS